MQFSGIKIMLFEEKSFGEGEEEEAVIVHHHVTSNELGGWIMPQRG
jgi:hypothetical protein